MLKHIIITFIFLATFVTTSSTANAANINNPLTHIPNEALENGSVIYDLGYKKDHDGRLVQGYKIVHYKNFYNHKPDHSKGNGGGNNGGGTSSCYAFLSNGTKWLDYEDYVVDPSNIHNLDHSSVKNIIADAITEWESHTNQGDIFAGENLNKTVDGVTNNEPDNRNEVMFGSIDSPGAIAVTTVWGVFSGPPWARYLAEWDMVFDQYDFDWSLTGESSKMDFENIAQHEIGHALGMGHPDNSCTEETMYAYASEGETKKRDLNSGDIEGIFSLYK